MKIFHLLSLLVLAFLVTASTSSPLDAISPTLKSTLLDTAATAPKNAVCPALAGTESICSAATFSEWQKITSATIPKIFGQNGYTNLMNETATLSASTTSTESLGISMLSKVATEIEQEMALNPIIANFSAHTGSNFMNKASSLYNLISSAQNEILCNFCTNPGPLALDQDTLNTITSEFNSMVSIYTNLSSDYKEVLAEFAKIGAVIQPVALASLGGLARGSSNTQTETHLVAIKVNDYLTEFNDNIPLTSAAFGSFVEQFYGIFINTTMPLVKMDTFSNGSISGVTLPKIDLGGIITTKNITVTKNPAAYSIVAPVDTNVYPIFQLTLVPTVNGKQYHFVNTIGSSGFTIGLEPSTVSQNDVCPSLVGSQSYCNEFTFKEWVSFVNSIYQSSILNKYESTVSDLSNYAQSYFADNNPANNQQKISTLYTTAASALIKATEPILLDYLSASSNYFNSVVKANNDLFCSFCADPSKFLVNKVPMNSSTISSIQKHIVAMKNAIEGPEDYQEFIENFQDIASAYISATSYPQYFNTNYSSVASIAIAVDNADEVFEPYADNFPVDVAGAMSFINELYQGIYNQSNSDFFKYSVDGDLSVVYKFIGNTSTHTWVNQTFSPEAPITSSPLSASIILPEIAPTSKYPAFPSLTKTVFNDIHPEIGKTIAVFPKKMSGVSFCPAINNYTVCTPETFETFQKIVADLYAAPYLQGSDKFISTVNASYTDFNSAFIKDVEAAISSMRSVPAAFSKILPAFSARTNLTILNYNNYMVDASKYLEIVVQSMADLLCDACANALTDVIFTPSASTDNIKSANSYYASAMNTLINTPANLSTVQSEFTTLGMSILPLLPKIIEEDRSLAPEVKNIKTSQIDTVLVAFKSLDLIKSMASSVPFGLDAAFSNVAYVYNTFILPPSTQWSFNTSSTGSVACSPVSSYIPTGIDTSEFSVVNNLTSAHYVAPEEAFTMAKLTIPSVKYTPAPKHDTPANSTGSQTDNKPSSLPVPSSNNNDNDKPAEQKPKQIDDKTSENIKKHTSSHKLSGGSIALIIIFGVLLPICIIGFIWYRCAKRSKSVSFA